MKYLIIAIILLSASLSFAADTKLREGINGPVQGSATSSLESFTITDNFSHSPSTTGWLWVNMNYNGTGTCIIRYMNTPNKSLYPTFTIPTGTQRSTVVNDDLLFYNYSGCQGQTGNNSVVEVQ